MQEAAAIQKIVDLAAPTEIDANGLRYTARKLEPVHGPVADTLSFGTLRGFADYILGRGADEYEGGHPFVRVHSPSQVEYLGLLDKTRQRECLAMASLPVPGFEFGKWHPHEQAMIGLQTLFQKTPELESLLKVLGTVTADEVRTLLDDGVTQQVTARAGTTLTERVNLPSPVTLQPYRTFREVAQPASQFVLRVKRDPAGAILVALFEADGGAWRIEAAANVAGWLDQALHASSIPIYA